MTRYLICFIGLFLATNIFAQSINQREDLVFNLDFETSFDADGPVDLGEHYVLADYKSNKLKFFDKESLTTVKSVEFLREGPNSTQWPMGMSRFNGSLIVLDFYKSEINFLDDKTVVGMQLDFLDKTNGNRGHMSTWVSRVTPGEKYIYVPFQPRIAVNSGEVNHKINSILRINVKTGEQDEFLPFPNNYLKPVAGGYTSFSSITYNQNKKSLFVSFPLNESVYEITGDSEVLEHKVDSKAHLNFDSHFYSDASEQKRAFDRHEYSKNYLEKESYWYFQYDKDSDIYWRIINLPIEYSDQELSTHEAAKQRKIRIEVLNSELKSIFLSNAIEGLDVSLNSGNAFVSPKGLHIKSNSQEVEEELRFKTFVFSKN